MAVAAHSVEIPAQLGPAQQAEQKRHHQQGDNHAHLHIGGDILAQFVVSAQPWDKNTGFLYGQKALIGHPNRLFADHGRHTFGKEHARQRDNKGLNPQMGHQEALDHAKGQANAQTNKDHSQHTSALAFQVHRAGHAHQTGNRAHTDVNAAGNHDDAHTTGQDDEGGIVIQDVEEVLRFGKASAQKENGGQI